MKELTFVGAFFRESDTAKSVAAKEVQLEIIDELRKNFSLDVLIFPTNIGSLKNFLIKSSSENNQSFFGYVNIPLIKQFIFNFSVTLRIMIRRPQFLIVYNVGIYNFIAIIVFKFIIKGKIIAFVQDVPTPGVNSGSYLQNFFDNRLAKLLSGLIDFPVPISEILHKKFFNNRGVVIEGGLSKKIADLYKNFSHNNCEKNVTNVFYSGSLDLQNGLDLIIEAEKLIPEDQKVIFHFAGRGELSEIIRKASLESNRIKFLGYMQHEELIDKIKAEADILLCIRISKKINTEYFFPSKIFEYLASGIPIVSTQFSALPSVYLQFLNICDESAVEIANMILEIHASPTGLNVFTQKSSLGKKWVYDQAKWEKRLNPIMDYIREEINQ
jgi:glycosyltransferase involved in cell wall biosynthesis